MLPKTSLILGGANSGKSIFAEKLVLSAKISPTYLATAQAWDDEMRQKINAHQEQRGPNWRTIEAPLDVSAPLKSLTSRDVGLLDCVTLWLSNHLLADHDVERESHMLCASLADTQAPVVIVSNEVGHGVVPDHALGRQFRAAQGRLNQKLAAQADLVVMITAGLPQVLKGQLPQGFE
ncbi:UNVERIFIED_CONTAM: hypothetical protein GTU68_018519 [Idotea baltica]|nr:hypothetical protein [Idotea baltica]